jgi:hypothetical protein
MQHDASSGGSGGVSIDPKSTGFEATIVDTQVRNEGTKKAYTVYIIQVVQLEQSYQIVRRYSEFDALHKRVCCVWRCE